MKIIELFENTQEDMIAAIKRDCKPFIQSKPGGLVMRGMTGKGDEIFKRVVRQDRKPLTMRADKHKAFDDWSKEKFGFGARTQCVFVTGDYGDAKSYGQPYAIFPIGDFRFIWSPEVGDLFMYNTTHIKDYDDLRYKDTDLADAVASNNEIMVYCKEYYAVPIAEDNTEYKIYQTFLQGQ